jgi:NhaA family Na+:H+ antiporter
MSRSRVFPPGTWGPAARAARALASPIQRILAVEATSGLVLLAAAAAALVWANTHGASYAALWHTSLGLELGPWAFSRSLHFWINEGLMTIFFLVVGLEIRREITVFYSEGLAPGGLGVAALGLVVAVVMRGVGVRAPLLYAAPGAAVWGGLLAAGIHPTLGGVVLGLMTPARPWFGPSGFAATAQARLEELPEDDRHALLARLDRIDEARREAVSPVERLIHALHPWVAFGVMPLFALANAGVVLGGGSLAGDARWLFAGIVAGLALGKPLGIVLASLGASRLGLAERSAELTRRGLVLIGLVGGIGFTMSLFIAQLVFPPGPYLDAAKLAILAGSGAAIVAGLGVGLVLSRGVRS